MAVEYWLGSFDIFKGIQTSIAKKCYILWFSRGPDPCPPSGSAHAKLEALAMEYETVNELSQVKYYSTHKGWSSEYSKPIFVLTLRLESNARSSIYLWWTRRVSEAIIFQQSLKRTKLYSNSAVIAVWLQSTRAQNILFWFTAIHSMSKFATTINFHDAFLTRLIALVVVTSSLTSTPWRQ